MFARDGRQVLGEAFPAVVAEPDGRWFVRMRGQAAVPREGREAALDYLRGRV